MSAINGVPLLVEGDPGVGKTSLAYATAKMLDLELLRVQFYDVCLMIRFCTTMTTRNSY